MTKKSGSGSSLFLMEMIVAVFFFILCSSTCILAFVRANSQSSLASAANRSVLEAESIAESIKGGRWEEFLAAGHGKKLEDGSFVMGWNRNWETAEALEDQTYQAKVSDFMDGQMENADIVIIRVQDQKELYRLQVKKYHMNSHGA